MNDNSSKSRFETDQLTIWTQTNQLLSSVSRRVHETKSFVARIALAVFMNDHPAAANDDYPPLCYIQRKYPTKLLDEIAGQTRINLTLANGTINWFEASRHRFSVPPKRAGCIRHVLGNAVPDLAAMDESQVMGLAEQYDVLASIKVYTQRY